MTHDNVLTIAGKYLVHDIDSATHPGERLAIILEHLERNTKLPNELLKGVEKYSRFTDLQPAAG